MTNEITGLYGDYEYAVTKLIPLTSRTLDTHIQIESFAKHLIHATLVLVLLQASEGKKENLNQGIEVVNLQLDFKGETFLRDELLLLDKDTVFTFFDDYMHKAHIIHLAEQLIVNIDNSKRKLIKESFTTFTIEHFNLALDLLHSMIKQNLNKYNSVLLTERESVNLQCSFGGGTLFTQKEQDTLDAKIKLYNVYSEASRRLKLTKYTSDHETLPSFVFTTGSKLLALFMELDTDNKGKENCKKLEGILQRLSGISKLLYPLNQGTISELIHLLSVEIQLAEVTLSQHIPFITFNYGIVPTRDSKVLKESIGEEEEPIMGEEILIYTPNSIPIEEIELSTIDTSYIDEFEI